MPGTVGTRNLVKEFQDEELDSLGQAERARYSIQYMVAQKDEELDSLGQAERARYPVFSIWWYQAPRQGVPRQGT